MRKVDHIVIHCSDSPNGRDDRAADIRRWHTDPKPRGRGWHVPGYHFVVCVDGAAEALVPLDEDQYIQPSEIANGVRGYNASSIHVCLIGTDKFTQPQWGTLRRLLAHLEFKHPDAVLVGHRDLDPHKDCPNFDVPAWRKDMASVEANHTLEAPDGL